MREIKFRAWDTDEDKYRYDISVRNGVADASWGKEKPEWVLEQYTGLKDKNGREIYEGDILLVPQGWSGDYHEKAQLSEVEYDTSNGGFYFSHPDDSPANTCEIVGNIHEDFNMLKANS